VAASEPTARVALSLFTAKNVGRAGSTVFVVALPLSLLGGREGDAGYLSAAIGVGGILGAFAVAGFAERRAMAVPMGLGLSLFGVAFAAIAVSPSFALAVACLVANGLANSVVDTSGYTLLARAVRDDVLARVLGVMETLRTLAVAAGGLLAPAAIDLIGLRWTLAVFGLAMPAAALAERRALRRADAGAAVPLRELQLLRESHLFAPLLPFAAEQLAAAARHVHAADGEVLMREGEAADCAYLIEAGTLRVVAGGREVALLGRADVAGEMGLLRSAPRSATVSAAGPADLLRIEAADFLAAIGGHPDAGHRADELVAARWAALRSAAAD
jgi:MFS family permease